MANMARQASEPGIPFVGRMNQKNRKNNFYLFFLDPQFDIVWLSRSFSGLCRKDYSFFIGKGIFDFFQDLKLQASFNQEIFSGLPDNISGRQTFSLPEMELCLEDCQWSLIPYQNEKRWVTGYFLVILDHQ